MERIFVNKNEYGKELVEMKGKICAFAERLEFGGYKAILYNGKTPILEGDLGIIELILEDIKENTAVELNGDKLTIHMKNEVITLTGHEEMSDGEIFARNYLDMCEDSYLVIKDNEMQVEMREDNFHDIKAEGFYDKCKDITNIRDFLGYDEESSVYKMNWDAIIVSFADHRELWQRA